MSPFIGQVLLFFSLSIQLYYQQLENLLRSSNNREPETDEKDDPSKIPQNRNQNQVKKRFILQSFRIYRVINRCAVCL